MSTDASYIANHTLLGVDVQAGYDVDIPTASRYSGMYILGKQGMGKSSLLEWLIFQDIAKGYAVIVIDPHGDLIDAVMSQMPEKKLTKAYLLDMEDEAYPFGVNVFSGKKTTGSIAQTQAVDRVMHIFEVIWGDILNQRDLPRYLRLATLVLLANPGTTLVDMYYFLRDDDDVLREKMLRNVRDPDIKYFWQQYQSKSPSARKKEIEPLYNRLEGLFLGRTLVKNIVGQSETSIDFRAAIENREIILIKLPRKILPQDAGLIGTMLTAQIHAAIFSFSDMPAEKRPGFSLYVDEFEHFATPDFAEMFSEGRKYGVRLTLAHQTRSQIPRTLETLRSTTFNAATVICFSAPDDATEMSRLFPAKAVVRRDDIDPDPVDFLLTYGHNSPIMDKFTREYLRPEYNYMLSFKGQTIERYSGMVINPHARYEEVKQGLAELSRFLYEVEKSGNWQQPIPYQFAEMFKTWDVWNYVLNQTIITSLLALSLSDQQQIDKTRQFLNSLPVSDKAMMEHYRSMTYGGEYKPIFWDKKEYNKAVASLPQKRENFLSFLIAFRLVMRYLAENPIGKLTAPSTTQVASQIISLKQRQALVKTIQSTYQIRTIDTGDINYIPRAAGATERQTRRRAILEQTHTKYCKKASEVEQAIMRRAGVYRQEAQPATAQDGRQQPSEAEQWVSYEEL